ncbi:MAG: hypothetical protein NDI61_09250 [Bdellovibrionaceae bacterium]|nr:hypothetical protein [Pseudobdellovibrionaceae bacterium]
MKIPDIKKATSVAVFFTEFYQLNRNADEFSYRRFADLVNWPHSYLNDLMSGRKPLTVMRALEFAKFAQFNSVETERLIVMSFGSSENPHVRSHFQSWLNSAMSLNSKNSPAVNVEELDPVDEVAVDPEFYKDFSLIALYTLIQWGHGQLRLDELGQMLIGFPEFRNEAVLRDKLSLLDKAGLIKKSGERIDAIGARNLIGSLDPLAEARSIVETLDRTLSVQDLRGMAQFGFVILPVDKLEEMSDRLCAFANWLLKNSEGVVSSCEKRNDRLIIRYDLFLTHALDLRKLGYDPLDLERNLVDQRPE